MDEEEAKKAEENEAGRRAAHTAGKVAATHFGGPLGNKVYDIASNTKAGQAIENAAGKAINSNPLTKKATTQMNKSGGFDIADAAIDASSGDLPKEGLAKEGLKKEGLEDAANKANNANASSSGEKGDSSGKSDSKGEEQGESSNSVSKNLLISIATVPGCGCACLLFLIIIIASIVTLPATAVINFFNNIFEKIGYAEDDKAEEDYYKKLKESQDTIYQKYGVCIDTNLIHATLTVNKSSDMEINEGELECEDPESCETGGESISAEEYKKMEKYIDLLANMQIKRKKYGLVKNKTECETEFQAIYHDQCSDTDESHVILVEDEEKAKECLDLSWPDWVQTTLGSIPVRDSSSKRLVARNDIEDSFFDFLRKKANREKNYEYYYYLPAATFEDRNDDGIEERYCEKLKAPESNTDFAQVEIGDWEHMEEGIYFWNLLDSFVEQYYPDYLNTGDDYAQEGDERYKQAVALIDRIYDLYTLMGPSATCNGGYGANVCADETLEASCENGVTVTGEGAGTYDLETYIAGVVQHENPYQGSNGSIESAKAQAIAARTYLLQSTNFCQKSIKNSQSAQTFSKNPGSVAQDAANQTRGLILTYGGKIFSSQYDSYCYRDKDCQDSLCTGNTCSVTYTKLPNGEQHVVSVPAKWKRWFVPGGGHARGMSQLAANNMADEGYSYKEILNYFYSPGVAVTAMIDSENEDQADLICGETYEGDQSIGGPATGSQIPPGQTYSTFDGQLLVDWARKYVGNPYVWGGSSLTDGADCSGFVMTLVKDLFGIILPHNSRAQVNYGTPVASLEEAKPGDLLFYSNEEGIYHVAIYAGNGTRVHAWSKKTGIVENSVGNPSYIRRLG